MDQAVKPPVFLSIAAVERDTGLSKDTLRVWERRYGFPIPQRDQFGERIYPMDQVDRLRAIRRLMDAGHRPGKIMGLSQDELQALADRLPSAAARESKEQSADLDSLMILIRKHQVEELRRELGQRVLRMGLAPFVTEVVAPLTQRVGDSWARGQLEVYEEHLFTESMQVILRNAISTIPHSPRRPKVLLTTFPGEPHGMGLLMVEALLALEGCRCVSLGVQTPILDISLAAQSQSIDIIALSFSQNMNPSAVADGLSELRQKVPASVRIWAGGRCSALLRRTPPGVEVTVELDDLSQALADWRRAHAA